jgi:hypothetical protein
MVPRTCQPALHMLLLRVAAVVIPAAASQKEVSFALVPQQTKQA